MTLDEKRIAIATERGFKFPRHDDSFPFYFHDPAAAVSLCEAMANGGHTIHVSFKEQWVCQLVWDGVDFECVADTFPAAVAECYGKAKGLWK